MNPIAKKKMHELIDLAYSQYGFIVTVTSMDRTIEEQTALYNAYLRGESVYPVARPQNSKHVKGLAFDIDRSPFDDHKLLLIGEIGEQIGLTWGGRWRGSQNDPIHFQYDGILDKIVNELQSEPIQNLSIGLLFFFVLIFWLVWS